MLNGTRCVCVFLFHSVSQCVCLGNFSFLSFSFYQHVRHKDTHDSFMYKKKALQDSLAFKSKQGDAIKECNKPGMTAAGLFMLA